MSGPAECTDCGRQIPYAEAHLRSRGFERVQLCGPCAAPSAPDLLRDVLGRHGWIAEPATTEVMTRPRLLELVSDVLYGLVVAENPEAADAAEQGDFRRAADLLLGRGED